MKVKYDICTSLISDKFYLYLIHFPGDKSVNKEITWLTGLQKESSMNEISSNSLSRTVPQSIVLQQIVYVI